MLMQMDWLRASCIVLGLAIAAIGQSAAQCLSAPDIEEVRAQGGAAAAGATSNDRIGRVVAPVWVNGQGPYRCIVDTGANRSVVSQRLAERLGLEQVGEGLVHSVHGATLAPLVAVDGLAYGDFPMPADAVTMLQGSMLAGEHGLLGVDGMQGRRLRLDFDDNCIEILPARSAPALRRGWTRLRGELRFGNLVVVRGRIDHLRVNVLVDTGSNISLANRALHEALAERSRYSRDAEGVARAYTAGDPVVLDSAIVLPELDIGALNDMLLYVGDFHVFSLWGLDEEPTVLVGMDVLSKARALAIDYERAIVYFRLSNRNRVGARLDDANFTSR